jgi:hypothetical protein
MSNKLNCDDYVPTVLYVYVPFAHEAEQPLDTMMPQKLESYILQQNWDAFCISTEEVVQSLKRDYMICEFFGIILCCASVGVLVASLHRLPWSMTIVAGLLLGVAHCVVTISYKFYYLPQLWNRMTAHCQVVQDTIFPGTKVQFQKADPSFCEIMLSTRTYSEYYIDIWVCREIEP